DLAGEAGAHAVRAAIESARHADGSLLATGLGVVTLVFGLWGVFGELQDALNTSGGSRPGPGVALSVSSRSVSGPSPWSSASASCCSCHSPPVPGWRRSESSSPDCCHSRRR